MPNVIAINAAAKKNIAVARATSDEMLLQGIAQGDRTAMHVLYSRHNVHIYRFVLRMVRDTTVSEDLVSQVFLDVWRTAEQFEGRSQVSTWLLSIARFNDATSCIRVTSPYSAGAISSIPATAPTCACRASTTRPAPSSCAERPRAARARVLGQREQGPPQRPVGECGDPQAGEQGQRQRIPLARRREHRSGHARYCRARALPRR